nr:MAG TPA: L-lactate dehydrogenase [Caudoviricetes sp.]
MLVYGMFWGEVTKVTIRKLSLYTEKIFYTYA